MMGTAPRRNNLFLLLPRLGGTLMCGVEERVAQSSDLVRFVFDGRHTSLSGGVGVKRLGCVWCLAVAVGCVDNHANLK